jgi:hypothetical protein
MAIAADSVGIVRFVRTIEQLKVLSVGFRVALVKKEFTDGLVDLMVFNVHKHSDYPSIQLVEQMSIVDSRHPKRCL